MYCKYNAPLIMLSAAKCAVSFKNTRATNSKRNVQTVLKCKILSFTLFFPPVSGFDMAIKHRTESMPPAALSHLGELHRIRGVGPSVEPTAPYLTV